MTAELPAKLLGRSVGFPVGGHRPPLRRLTKTHRACLLSTKLPLSASKGGTAANRTPMKPDQLQALVPPGWIGGFAESDPAFKYPTPDLSSLEMLDNMANINLLQRQWPVEWPEFSWETQKGQADPKRCFQMFAPYISRLGYTDTGRVYSIICPQQGVCHLKMGCMNVEVTVTGQRGWVNETTREMAADMKVMGQIWFS